MLTLVCVCVCVRRAESEASKEVVKRYDWTYTTDYRGTLLGDHLQIQVPCALTLKPA